MKKKSKKRRRNGIVGLNKEKNNTLRRVCEVEIKGRDVFLRSSK